MENRVKDWTVQYIFSVLDREPVRIDAEVTFEALGPDSVEAIIMPGLMEEEFQNAIDPIELYENPGISLFVPRFAKQHSAETAA